MWTLSGFADEISPDLGEQVETLRAENMRWLELRGVWDTNILDLTDEQVERVRQTLAEAGIGVSSIGSPIGKIGIDDDFAPHLERVHRAIELAHTFQTPFIRIFSFFIPEGDDPARHRDAVIVRLGQIVAAAEGQNVTLLHENERHIYGDVPDRCLDILQTIDSPNFRAVWDPANFVLCGVTPHDDGYDQLRPYIAYVHVKDAKRDGGQVVPPGGGAGQVRETIRAQRASGFDGFLWMEPHHARGGSFSGFSGPELFQLAVQRFTALLAEEGIAWA